MRDGCQSWDLPPRCFAVGSLSAADAQPSVRERETGITIEPSVPWNVTGRDDLAQLKHLAAGIGWEFEPNADTTAGLKAVGMQTIRCINVDPLPGRFAADGSFQIGQPDRLLAHLETCRELGAKPHIIMATGCTRTCG